jgi:DNA repair photolyase
LITIKETLAKTLLTKTGIEGYDYCINPYVGCEHGCRYCYASFMKCFTGHLEPWSEFVDVKVNAPEVLRRQLRRARKGSILIGTVTDPYQPAEKHYRITRGCLEALLERQFSVNILTRSFSFGTFAYTKLPRFTTVCSGMPDTTIYIVYLGSPF